MPPLHVMPSMCETVSIFKYAKYNVTTLCRLVGKLRGGQAWICDTYQVPACGSFNWTILGSFLDGVEWVLRSPRDDSPIKSDETNLLLLASEAAILKYIGANSTIPVPEVFAYRQARPLFLILDGANDHTAVLEKTMSVSPVFL